VHHAAMDHITRRSAAAWIIGGAAWTITALVGSRSTKGSGGFYVTETSWLFVHLLVLTGIARLLRTAVSEGSRWERAGFTLAAVGRVLFFSFEVAAMIVGDDELPVFPIAVASTGVGMLIGGAALLRSGRWSGWTRLTPLSVGAYPFVFIIPVFAATGERPPDVLIAGWGVAMALVGYAMTIQPSGHEITTRQITRKRPSEPRSPQIR
jgi:hypothetical protein